MIRKCEGFTYPDLELTAYKDEPGTWVGTSRRVLAEGPDIAFQTRYFEIAPGGYTSFEKHGHEHVVVVTRGTGEVLLNGETSALGPGDVVHVTSWTPHQFRNPSDEPFGIVCVVNSERDRPVLLETDGHPRTSEKG